MRERLASADQALLCGVFVEGRSAREVGAQLGLSETAAARRSHRLKQKVMRISEEQWGAVGSR